MARGKPRPVNRDLVSVATIRRMPLYLQICRQAEDVGIGVISGTFIAEELGLEAIQVRKDLSMTGVVGRPRIGYVLMDLIHCIETFLRWDVSHPAVLIGAGVLGKALISYQDFRRNNLNILWAFDSDPKEIGKFINGIEILDPVLLPLKVPETKIEVALICTPEYAAQEAVDLAVKAGIVRIWNFTAQRVRLPQGTQKGLIYTESIYSGYAVLTTRA